MSSEIVRVPFRGDEVLTVEVGGKPHIVLKPALESIGVDYEAQRKRLYRRSWAVTSMTEATGSDGKRYQMVTVDVRTFLMMLATVDENRVSEEVRPKLVAYQSEVADAIEQYWTQGGAINPRATEDQLARIADLAAAQGRALSALSGIVDPQWLEAKARHVAARALGEEPEIDPITRPLNVGEYLTEVGIPRSEQRRIAPAFGKVIKAQYVLEHGREPDKVERFIDGALRMVNGYTEADRGLFEAAWREMHEEDVA